MTASIFYMQFQMTRPNTAKVMGLTVKGIASVRKVYYSPERKTFYTNNMYHEVSNTVCFKTFSIKWKEND